MGRNNSKCNTASRASAPADPPTLPETAPLLDPVDKIKRFQEAQAQQLKARKDEIRFLEDEIGPTFPPSYSLKGFLRGFNEDLPIDTLLKELKEVVLELAPLDRHHKSLDRLVGPQASVDDGSASSLTPRVALIETRKEIIGALVRSGVHPEDIEELCTKWLEGSDPIRSEIAPRPQANANSASATKRRSRSEFTRSVTSALIRAPGATGLQLSMSLDEDGVKSTPAMKGRSYEETYKTDPKARKSLNSRYSKRRRILRD